MFKPKKKSKPNWMQHAVSKIKPKNDKDDKEDLRKFCGGKITPACIAKGKQSKNPKIRKQAYAAEKSMRQKEK